jgi:hypothetical protein
MRRRTPLVRGRAHASGAARRSLREVVWRGRPRAGDELSGEPAVGGQNRHWISRNRRLEAAVVRPAKAGAFCGRQSHRGKSRNPVARVAGLVGKP